MKLTFAILSLAVFYCTAQGASISNVDELNQIVTSVTSKISNLLKRVESEDEVAHITEAVEEIRIAAEIVISKTSKMMHDGNAPNQDDVRKVDIMKFIAEKAVSAEEVVKVLFTEDKLAEDDWRVVLLMRSLRISSEEGDKRQELNNVKVWCQAIVKICGAMVSTIYDAEITLKAQLGIFSDEQQVLSDGNGVTERSPTGDIGSPDKHHRQRRQSWTISPLTLAPLKFEPLTLAPWTIAPQPKTSNWGLDQRGITWTSNNGRHDIWARPTFSQLRPDGFRIGYTYTFGN